MSNRPARATPRRAATMERRGGTAALLYRLLDEPQSVARLRRLGAPDLAAVVRHVGLEDCGELLCLTTAEQLAGVFDFDLWVDDGAGRDERFDDARFARWLEVLCDAGDEERGAELLAGQDEDLLILGLAQRMLVLDLDDLAPQLAAWGSMGLEQAHEVERLEQALDSAPGFELEGYRLIATEAEGFDAIVTLLTTLDQERRPLLERLLRRLAALGRDRLDEEGPAKLLGAAESLEADVGGEREARRAAAGYVAPSSAAAFLRTLVRDSADVDELRRSRRRDPISSAYFRELEGSPSPRAPAPREPSLDAQPGSLARLLADAGVEPQRGALALGPANDARGTRPHLAALGQALGELAARAPELHQQRLMELVYLANALAAAGDVAGRRHNPVEAAEVALDAVARGLHDLCARGEDPQAVLAAEHADWLFRLGRALEGQR